MSHDCVCGFQEGPGGGSQRGPGGPIRGLGQVCEMHAMFNFQHRREICVRVDKGKFAKDQLLLKRASNNGTCV